MQQVTRDQVLAFRVHAQQLDRPAGRRRDAAVLDLGVQDTGPDGALWALELRGARPSPDDLVWAWTLRGAPHAYRRGEIAQVAAAVAPWSEADASKRVFDAAKKLREAGIPVLDALDAVAAEMRDVAASPVPKGEMSSALTQRMPDAYLRWCNPCGGVIHMCEQTFRLSAVRGGLELEPGTSPPTIRRIPGWRGIAKRRDPSLDPIRGVLRLLGPATPKQVAEYVDAPVRDVKQRWPDDVEQVQVDGEERSVLAEDLAALTDPPDASGLRRLLGPFDLFLQGRDRSTLVPDDAARKDLWRTIGRPGGVLVGHEVIGSWRPRTKSGRLRLALQDWHGRLPDLTEEAERLAAFRGVAFDGFVED